MCRDIKPLERIVSRASRLTSRAVIAAIIVTISFPGPLSATDASDAEALRREARQLRAELAVLRTAVAEAAELELQRSANLSKQMRDLKNGSEPGPAPPVASTETGGGSREINAALPPTAAEERPARVKHRRHRHSTRSRSKATRSKTRD